MQTCLINACTSAEISDVDEFKLFKALRESSEPQLGILSLAAVLESQHGTPSIVDLNRSFYAYAGSVGEGEINDFASIAASEIASVDAQLYGFGSICSAYPLTIRIAKAVKQLRPESKILFGGPQASVVSDQTLAAFPFVDFILRGESEQTLPRLLEELSGDRKLDLVPGLTHRSIWGIQRNPEGPLILDLDVLPSPAYHLTGELHGAKRASLELGRGCPFACTFCSTNDFFRRKFRLRSPQRVLSDMRAIKAEYGITDFDLVHDMFTVDRKRVQAFCHTLLESGERYTWSCSARTDCVDEELIELMAAAGCTGMFFGVETGSERMQRIIDKHLDTRRAHQIIDIVEKAGIRSTISLITGFPEENRQDLHETLQMFMHSARTPRSSPQLQLLAPLADTPVHRAHKEEMTLDLLCSVMSHQGRRQHVEDMELIRRYPAIFPNFYLLPTQYLDRSMLLELREFTLMAKVRFRWLLGACDQATSGILNLSSDWIARREEIYPGLAGAELRHYYRTPRFAEDFFIFLRRHTVGDDPVVQVFLDFEEGVMSGQTPDQSELAGASRLAEEDSLDWSDLPVRTGNSRVVWLSANLEEMIEAVKHCTRPDWKSKSHSYVVSQAESTGNPIFHVSSEIATILAICDGLRTIGQVVNSLSPERIGVSKSRLDYTVLRLMKKAQSEGLLAFFRLDSAGVEGHGAGLAVV